MLFLNGDRRILQGFQKKQKDKACKIQEESLTPQTRNRPPFLLARQSIKGFEAEKKQHGVLFLNGDR
ncbi:MAG: hypothetical protein J6V42_00190, partial [Clostridia bacterium]|nr:hypothetical protein [Clostridia bacterium]